MNISGKTPLFRAKKIESELGVKEVYLKLEGTNPYGHKIDRVSEVLIRDAMIQHKRHILVDGSKDYINSMMYFAEVNDLKVVVPQFKNEKWKRTSFKNEQILNLTRAKFENKISFIEELCLEHNYYNAANGHNNRHLSILALEDIGDEIAEKLKGQVSTVFTQLSYGHTVSSLYNGFVRTWVQGEIEKYPKIISSTIPKGNAIYDDYKKNFQLEDLDSYQIEENKYTRHLFIKDSMLLEETLKAVHDTGGEILSIDTGLLIESANYLKKKENILLTTEEAYSFAGFYKMAKEGKLEDGKHVVVLNNGKSDIQIERVEDFSKYSPDDLVGFVTEWLMEYKDSVEETKDAILNAMEKGFVYIAYRNGKVQGICVVVNLGFETFIPKYHLAYIGTKVGNKGRGIASELISQVVDVTGGNISLHVDIGNSRAEKLYEKFGFKHKYNRMIYSDEGKI